MKKEEVLKNLKELASQIEPGRVIRLKDVRTVPRLSYYIDLHFGKLGNALKELGLPTSSLASKMSVTNEDLLKYLNELQNQLGRRPTTLDLKRDTRVYKKFASNRFSPNIFKTRFGGFRNALLQVDSSIGRLPTSSLIRKDENAVAEVFQNKPRFYGKGAELHVTAELLYRGFQAANIPVDEGLDILAVKDKKTFYFQVKHKDLSRNNESIHVTRSSFEKKAGGDVYYVFVLLSDEKRDFLIVPYHIINDWIRMGLAQEKEKGYSFLIIRGSLGGYRLGDVDISKYLDRWDDIK